MCDNFFSKRPNTGSRVVKIWLKSSLARCTKGKFVDERQLRCGCQCLYYAQHYLDMTCTATSKTFGIEATAPGFHMSKWDTVRRRKIAANEYVKDLAKMMHLTKMAIRHHWHFASVFVYRWSNRGCIEGTFLTAPDIWPSFRIVIPTSQTSCQPRCLNTAIHQYWDKVSYADRNSS